MPLPFNEEPTPVSLFQINHFCAADAVIAIVLSLDRFYKPKITYRRKFTLNGVEKYYPTCDIKIQAQNSFLYRNTLKACENFILGECVSENFCSGRCNTFYMLDVPSNLTFKSKKSSGTKRNSSFLPVPYNAVSFAHLTFFLHVLLCSYYRVQFIEVLVLQIYKLEGSSFRKKELIALIY